MLDYKIIVYNNKIQKDSNLNKNSQIKEDNILDKSSENSDNVNDNNKNNNNKKINHFEFQRNISHNNSNSKFYTKLSDFK